MDKLYTNIRNYRKLRKMSQERLAELAGYTDRSSIAKIEKGLVDLPQSKIVDIAKALNVSPGELMGEAPHPMLDFLTNEDYEMLDRIKGEKGDTAARLYLFYELLNRLGKDKEDE